ncbi:MAG: DUF1501 domain-containing protein [Planctomycetes bacterium]|nr:DUF1501 domain-containing protein [Planctomycetota bacterium]
MLKPQESRNTLTRRCFFDRVSDGICGAALTYLLQNELLGARLFASDESHGELNSARRMFDLTPKRSQFPPTANSVIHLCMQGGPSQVDLFDPKPALKRYHGSAPPRELTKGAIFENDRTGTLMQSPFKFSRHGECGAPVSELLPHIGGEVDSLAIVRSMYNVHPNHEPAIYKMQSGQTFPGHPVFGSWVAYGLGSENQNLPAYVVLADPSERLPTNGVENWFSGYLPPLYQGTPMRTTGSPLLNLKPDYEEPLAVTEAKRDLIARLDQIHKSKRPSQPVLDARINNYEMAARMQLEATQTLDLNGETAETLAMYGIGEKETDSFGRRCLLARRMIERGVRFVQLFPKGQAWDNHSNIRTSLRDICGKTDKPVAGLLRDLRQRGLIDSTLVLWGGEFGRLPLAQVNSASQYTKAGRDHGPYGFTAWMAGGGVKGGTTYGNTDDIGYASVEDRVSIQDWHATILHLLGLRHEELFFERNGLNDRLTHQFDTRVVKEIVA